MEVRVAHQADVASVAAIDHHHIALAQILALVQELHAPVLSAHRPARWGPDTGGRGTPHPCPGIRHATTHSGRASRLSFHSPSAWVLTYLPFGPLTTPTSARVPPTSV